MKKNGLILIVALSVIALQSSCKKSPEKAPEKLIVGERQRTGADKVTLASVPYVNDDHGFSIRFPEGWRVKGSTVTHTVVKARLSDESAPITFLSVAVYPASETQDMSRLSADRLFREYIVAGQQVDAEMRSSGRTTLGGMPAIWMEVDVRSPRLVSGLSLTYFVPKEGRLFRVSGSTEKNEAWFRQNRPTFEASIQSFRFTGSSRARFGSDGARRPYVDPKHHFSILMPEVWKVGKSISGKETVAIKAVHRDSEGRFATLIVYAHDPKDLGVDFATSSAEELFRASGWSEGQLLASGETALAGQKTLWMKFSVSDPIPSYALAYMLVHEDTLFVLFGQTLLGDKQWFEQNEALLVSAIRSFKFVP